MHIQNEILLKAPPQVLKTYYSKRNTVRLLRCRDSSGVKLVILKEHRTLEGASVEFDTLVRLSRAGLAVPAPLDRDGNKLYLQYLEGDLLVDVLERNLIPRSVWTSALASWYYTLHQKTASADGSVMLKADNNLRNFLFKDGVVYGLDFEETGRGDRVRDLGQLCAYILANRPAFTHDRLAEAASVIRHYLSYNPGLPVKKVEDELILELQQMAERHKDLAGTIKCYLDSLIKKDNFL